MEADFGMEGVFVVEGGERPPRKDSLQDFYDMLNEEYGQDEDFIDRPACLIDLTDTPEDPIVTYLGSAGGKGDTRGKRKRERGQQNGQPPISGKVGKKRKKGGQMRSDAVGQFYGEVLSWELCKLHSQSLSLPISANRMQFDTVSQFYNHCRQLVMEETSANLCSGLQSIHRASSITLRYSGEESKQVGGLLQLTMEVAYGPLELTKPGSCFVIYPKNCKYPKFNFSQPRISSNENMIKAGIFGAIAPNREAAATKRVPLYVHESYYSTMVDDAMLQRGSIWVAYEVANVITAQRMAAVCDEQPKPPFLSKLQGGKIASHIIFEDADEPLSVVNNGGISGPSSFGALLPAAGIIPGNSLIAKRCTAVSREGFSKRLNTSQLAALDDVVRNTCGDTSVQLAGGRSIGKKGSLSLVQGPPGCGKSTFLTALLEELVLRKGRRVLACAPSNRAVCVLLEKFLFMKDSDPAHEACSKNVVLIGVEDKLDTNFKLSNSCTVQKALNPMLGSMGSVPGGSQVEVYSFSTTTLSAVSTVTNPTDAFDMFAFRLADHYKSAFKGLATDMNRFLGQVENLSAAQTAASRTEILRFIGRFKNHIDNVLERMMHTCPSVTSREFKSRFSTIDEIYAEVNQCIRSSMEQNFTDGSRWNLKLLSIAECLDEVSIFLCSAEAAALIAGEAISNADVVFCTLSCAGQSLLKRVRQIDVMVVDEAAQALEPELCIAFSLYPDNLVLVGDPCQLSATLLSTRAQMLGRGDSTMKRLMNFCDRPFHLLSTQYRMHPELSKLPNKLFYKNRISDSNHVIDRARLFLINATTSPIPWLADFAFIDIDGLEHTRDGSHRFSMSNSLEAQFIAKLMRYLATSYSFLDVGSQVCVITFYSGQVAAIMNSIKSEAERMRDKNLANRMRATKVMTVDSFQGSETDVVILSFVRSNAMNKVGFLSDFSRINVAITRAKHNLICVGNADTLENCKLDYLRMLVANAKERLKFFSASAICSAYFPQ